MLDDNCCCCLPSLSGTERQSQLNDKASATMDKKKKHIRTSWKVHSSQMAKSTCNPIRKIVDGMSLTPNPKKQMIALSIGDPTTFGNMLPCEEMKKAVISALKGDKHNGYAPSTGYVTTRAAIAKRYTCPEAPLEDKDVILASGCSHALDLAISVLANPGQNILVPRPGFSIYKTLAESLSIMCKNYDLRPEKSWEIDLTHLSSLIDDNTAAIVVNNPSNPCGSVYSKEHLKDILKVAEKHFIPIISDEIYADFVFPEYTFFPMASLTKVVPILTCGGLTKRYLVPGWRMGWIFIHDQNNIFEQVRAGLISLSQRILGPNTVIQGAVEDILNTTPQSFYDDTIKIIKDNADVCYEAFIKTPGLKPIMPSGAMYMMVGIDINKFPKFKDDLAFTERMITEQSVFCLPSKCFQYPNYFRVVLTLPLDITKEACDRILQFCNKHYQEVSRDTS